MRLRSVSRSVLAVLALAMFTAIGAGASVVRAPGYAQAAHSYAPSQLWIRGLSARLDASCPAPFRLGCYTVSAKSGLVQIFCAGTSSSPCGGTNQFLWSGTVCTNPGPPCRGNPTEEMTAAWAGPFSCNPTACFGSSTGTYETDTITPEKGLKRVKRYAYKQNITVCFFSSPFQCNTNYIGLNVGP
jgi:hypothetical protein